jgi:SAM-dependent methyltransferase
MEESLDWFEDEQFWIRFAPVMFNADRWADTPWETENLLRLAPVPDGAALLDSCCGVGRHALEFARRGYRVTAVDRTRAYIEAARDSAEAENLTIEFLTQDVRGFRRPRSFSLALNLFTSFGFFSSMDEEIQYITNIRESLLPGGSFVIDLNGKEILSRDFNPSEEYELDGYTVRGEYRIEDDFCRLENRWSLESDDGESFSYSFSHRIYSAAELRSLLLECGFSTVRIYGGFDGRAYDNNALRLITVAET